MIRYADFADIVHGCRIQQKVTLLVIDTDGPGKYNRYLAHSNSVQTGFFITKFRCPTQFALPSPGALDTTGTTHECVRFNHAVTIGGADAISNCA